MDSRLVEQHKSQGSEGFQPENDDREGRAPTALTTSLVLVLYFIELYAMTGTSMLFTVFTILETIW